MLALLTCCLALLTVVAQAAPNCFDCADSKGPSEGTYVVVVVGVVGIGSNHVHHNCFPTQQHLRSLVLVVELV